MTLTASQAAAAPTGARRVQYRVGHGGFHATFVNPNMPSHTRLTYVYDVGAKPSKALLKQAIAAFVDDLTAYAIDRVDYIVISHIDEDHVNGLSELLSTLKAANISVKSIILPWLSPVQKLLTQSRNNHRQLSTTTSRLGGTDAEADAFLRRAGVENVVRVTAIGDEGGSSSTSAVLPQGTSVTQPAAPPKHTNSSNSAIWTLIPVKTPVPHGFEQLFRSELRRLLNPKKSKTGLNPDNVSDHEEILTKHKRKIRTAMKKVSPKVGVAPDDITNWSSLALLHGSSVALSACVLGNPITRHVDVACIHGWLHTGDLPLKNPAVWTNLSTEVKKSPLSAQLCVVAAPHHGSDHNHAPALYASRSPGTVLFTTGRQLSGKVGAVSYGVPTTRSRADVIGSGATLVDLYNV